ncbi:MAG: LysR substrate-binding domain-containing protein [Pseudomonadota bacterium]
MAMPSRRLPALGALHAFEAAARLSSFKAAAAELSVTPGAISQRIRTLEEDLKVRLFTRSVRQVTLTDAGRQLQPELAAAFLQIRDAVDRLAPAGDEPLRVEASAPVIAKWVLPRLHRFTERYPALSVSIGTGHDLRPCGEGEVFIRFNETPGMGVFAVKLCEEHLLPLASPELVERLDLRKPADILRAPLLHDMSYTLYPNDPCWATWFVRAGLNPADAKRGMRFDPMAHDHAMDAAASGAGVVLGRRLLARGDMAEGRLVCPFGPVIPMNVNYYVLCREGHEARPGIAAFINWMREETAAVAGFSAPDGGRMALLDVG